MSNTNEFSNIAIWPIDRRQADNTTAGSSGPGNNVCEGARQTPQSSRIGASKQDAV